MTLKPVAIAVSATRPSARMYSRAIAGLGSMVAPSYRWPVNLKDEVNRVQEHRQQSDDVNAAAG